jgi:serine/threonine protein kinase
MREVHGETLHDAVNHAYGPNPTRWRPRQLIEAFRRVVEAVAYAHERGVVHRDLKPENIMLGRFGEALVVDWGLAKVLGGVEPSDLEGAISVGPRMQTQWGHIMGTPKFMAPEQAAGDLSELGPHTDVYALGAILYLILSGKRPYDADTASEVLRQVVAGDYQPLKSPRRVPAYLRRACAKAMSYNVSDRYPDGAALLAAVDPGQRTVSVAIRIGVQHDGRVEHAILPLGEGITLGALRKRLGTRVLSCLRATTPLLSVSGDRVTVYCPKETVGIVADERNSDDTFRLEPGSSQTVDAGAKGWLLLDNVKLLFQVGALDFDPQ